MKTPTLINIEDIKHHEYETDMLIDGQWVSARPISYWRFWIRFKLAWGVFCGKYDALYWPKQ